MAFTKRTYKDNETVITAENLNAIQDELLRVANGFDNGDFDGEPGEDGVTPNLSIGTVTTLSAGSNATASITGTTENPVLNLGIPKGKDGATPEFSIGTVTTLSAGSNATASITGTAENPVLNLGIPKGKDGTSGGGSGGTGVDGEDGGYYVPAVNSSGDLSWSPTKADMPPVPTVNIKGGKGDTGAAGYTPQRGTDYWTSSDIAEIKSYVDEAILGGEW